MTRCSACQQDFTGLRDFDSHRTGRHAYPWGLDHPNGRRCLSAGEMEEKNWWRDAQGCWSSPAHHRREDASKRVEGSPRIDGDGLGRVAA